MGFPLLLEGTGRPGSSSDLTDLQMLFLGLFQSDREYDLALAGIFLPCALPLLLSDLIIKGICIVLVLLSLDFLLSISSSLAAFILGGRLGSLVLKCRGPRLLPLHRI